MLSFQGARIPLSGRFTVRNRLGLALFCIARRHVYISTTSFGCRYLHDVFYISHKNGGVVFGQIYHKLNIRRVTSSYPFSLKNLTQS